MIVARTLRRKTKDHHHHQRDGQQQRILHVRDGRSNRRGAVRQNVDVDGSRKRRLQLRQNFLDAINYADDVRARLPLNVQNHRRLLVGPRRLAHIFRAIDCRSHVRQPHRRAIPIRHDNLAVALAGQQLVVRANRECLMQSVKRAFGLIDVGIPQRGSQIFQTQSIRRQTPWDWPAPAPRDVAHH